MFERKPSKEPLQLALFPELAAPPEDQVPRHTAASDPRRERLLRRPEAAPQPPAVLPPLPAPAAPRTAPLAAPPKRREDGLLQVLVQQLGPRLASLILTNNRSRIISARPERDGSLHLRVHRSFAEAPPEIVAALVTFLKTPRRAKRAEALQAIRAFFDSWQKEVPPARARCPRKMRLLAQGRFFDLTAMRDEVNRQYFGGQLEVAITWGKSGAPLRKKRGFSIRLGSYHERENLVRIHPVLDREDVPFHVVESIVHHEMVHAVVPTERGTSRRIVHGPEFRRLERLYEHHEEAEAWLKANVERLAKQR